MSDKQVVEIKATRHKGGTWTVHVKHPDGSWERHTGLVDDGHAANVVSNALWKIEAAA